MNRIPCYSKMIIIVTRKVKLRRSHNRSRWWWGGIRLFHEVVNSWVEWWTFPTPEIIFAKLMFLTTLNRWKILFRVSKNCRILVDRTYVPKWSGRWGYLTDATSLFLLLPLIFKFWSRRSINIIYHYFTLSWRIFSNFV